MDSQELWDSDNSLSLSITPSPLVGTLDDLDSSQQSVQNSSQVSLAVNSQCSSVPSPAIVSLNQMLRGSQSVQHPPSDACEFGSNLENLNMEQKRKVFAIVMPQMNKTDLQNQSENVLLHISKIFGEFCRDKIKLEADSFRLKRSRDDSDRSSVDILSKKLKIEEIHCFFEAATGKSGRVHHRNQHKVANFQATFYESLLKAGNLHTLGPYSLMLANQINLKVPSKAIFENQLGGSYTFHNSNTPSEKPLEMSHIGPLISDNAQLGANKYQHYGIGKLDRATPVFVSTHNIRAESATDMDDNKIFKEENVVPYNHQYHPLFRPVGPEFYKVVEDGIKMDEESGLRALNTVQQKWIDEVNEDRQIGGGLTSFQKLSEGLDSGTPDRIIICQKCHVKYKYSKETVNICPNQTCGNNPTFFDETELGPYKCYNFPTKAPNTVIIREQEPIGLNPSGRQNLFKLHNELKNYWPSDVKCFPFYGDGLPAVSYERIKCDSVTCNTHSVNIPITDSKLLADHCTEECVLDWPLKDLYVLNGMSHEEIAMNVTALTSNTQFGVLDMLSAMGRINKNSQLQAIRSKRLHTLYELNFIYTKAAFTATVVPFLDHCDTTQAAPSVENLYKYVSNAPNLEYQARFRVLVALNLPCIVKRLGIRLNSEEISAGGSALFMPAAFSTKMSWYRDYYHFKGRF